MGRPLKEKTIEDMNLQAKSHDGFVVLGKQVGFNKYLVEEGRVVRLGDKVDAIEDVVVLPLMVAGEQENVKKILKNLIHTDNGVYAYSLVDGQIVFERSDVEFSSSEEPVVEEPAPMTRRKSKKEEPVVEELVVEEPVVEEPVVEEPVEEEVIEEIEE